MHKCLSAIITVVLLACAPMVARCDKVTRDPNAPGAAKPAVKQEADPRLAQNVTYYGGYKRLSALADELSKETGVGIRSGSSPMDWQVRDIPMVVAVRDVPLGKLLDAIAACAHAKLVAERIGPDQDQAPSYRFTRTKAQRDDLDQRANVIADANRKLASWAWDALVAYAGKPELKLTVENKYPRFAQIDSQQVRLVAEVLACLGTDAKQKTMNGEQVTLTYSTFPSKDLLRSICNYAAGHPEAGMHGFMNASERLTPTDEEIKSSLVITKMTSHGDSPDEREGFSFMVYGIPAEMNWRGKQERITDSWTAAPIELANALVNNKVAEIPAKPDVQSKLYPKDEFPVDGFVPLSDGARWDAPALQQKVTLGLAKTKDGPTSAEALVELARKSGINIVTEDFVSHKTAMYSRMRIDLTREIALAEALRNADPVAPKGRDWFVNPEHRLVCGWANGWRDRHKDLVPESMLSRIQQARQTTGAELEDLIPIIMLTDHQRYDWIENTRDRIFCGSVDHYVPLWRLYTSLDGDDKAAARSSVGLPLAKLDTRWVSDFLSKQIDQEEAGIIHMSPPEELARHPSRLRAVCSPEKLACLFLRAVRVPLDHWTSVVIGDGEHPTRKECCPPTDGSITKHTYRIELSGKLDGEDFSLGSAWQYMAFPYFTVEREAELAAKALPCGADE